MGTWSRGSLADTACAAVVLDTDEGETSALICLHIAAADLGAYSALSVSAVVAGGSGAKLGAAWANLVDLDVSASRPTSARRSPDGGMCFLRFGGVPGGPLGGLPAHAPGASAARSAARRGGAEGFAPEHERAGAAGIASLT